MRAATSLACSSCPQGNLQSPDPARAQPCQGGLEGPNL